MSFFFDEEPCYYALVADRGLVAAIVPTDNGWRCRSNVRGALNHDYVSHQPASVVRKWIERDYPPPRLVFTADRDKALGRLSEGQSWGRYDRLDPTLSTTQHAAQVLAQLETA